MRDCLIFDLDGTLVDSAPDIEHALSAALEEEGRRCLSLIEVREMIGDGARNLVQRALLHTGDDARLDLVLSRFLSLYLERACEQTRMYPGALEMLADLQQRGFRFALCTNKPLAHTHLILHGLGLAPFFPVVVGGDSLPVRKPDPGPVRLALEGLGSTPGHALLVGDSGTDAFAARAAHVPCVLLRHGYSRVPIDDLPAVARVDGLDQLVDTVLALSVGPPPLAL